MTSKFFSLIKDGSVHLSAKTKIIKAEAFAELLSSMQVLEKVKQDALIYKEEVAVGLEQEKETASKSGFEAGFAVWSEHIAKLQKEIESVRSEYAKMLAPVALKAAKKIVGNTFEISDESVYDIVVTAMKPVLQHKKITIWVNKEDTAVLEKHRQDLKNLFETIEVLSVRERDDITRGGCVIETEGGIINAQLENQWAVLEKAFESLFKGKAPANEAHEHEAKSKG